MSVVRNKAPSVILASASPRRVELLNQIGVDCDVRPVDIDESVKQAEEPKDYVLRLARQKAAACVSRLPASLQDQPIIAADTTVVYGGRIFGKPNDEVAAAEMLRGFSGQVHHVHTAVSLAFQGELDVRLSTTAVQMMTISESQIADYIRSGEYRGKAGGYGIQGLAAAWIQRIDGSYSCVMGLPIYETAVMLRKIGLLVA